MIREDRELLTDLARLNRAMAPLALRNEEPLILPADTVEPYRHREQRP